MLNKINHQRHRFLGIVAMTIATTQLGRFASAIAYPNLIYYNQIDKSGHFAAWEQPMIFAQELRADFKSLRLSK